MFIDDIVQYIFTPVAQVAIIVGLAEVAKRIGLPKKWIPLLDVFLGIVTGIVAFGLLMGYGIGKGVYIGLGVGLAAGGLFDVVKKSIFSIKSGETGSEEKSDE